MATTRDLLIEATGALMVEEGYAAATSRRVAARAGVKPALVHYHFPNSKLQYECPLVCSHRGRQRLVIAVIGCQSRIICQR